ncbi:MAG: flavodoxin domain-containing protein [Chloroflexi bacterium]|nr:flavodoxin domain-containing protein [Chloroflexota bacterium]
MRVLVTAASRHGSTWGIATAIAGTLQDSGIDVDLLVPDDVMTLEDYDGVVIGSAVYAGHWQAEARRLVDRYHDVLSGMPVWLFSSGPLSDVPETDDIPAEQPIDDHWAPDDLPMLFEQTLAREHRVFPGRLDTADVGIPTRVLMRLLHQQMGDHRPWTAIRAWANEIAAELTHARVPVEA